MIVVLSTNRFNSFVTPCFKGQYAQDCYKVINCMVSTALPLGFSAHSFSERRYWLVLSWKKKAETYRRAEENVSTGPPSKAR
jgi:hypothetical protein